MVCGLFFVSMRRGLSLFLFPYCGAVMTIGLCCCVSRCKIRYNSTCYQMFAHFYEGDLYSLTHFYEGDLCNMAHFHEGDLCDMAHFHEGDLCGMAQFYEGDLYYWCPIIFPS